MTSKEIEILVADYFNYRANLIVPNVSWGLGVHECDILVLTKAGYAWEVEIKTSVADVKADLKKKHGHNSRKIRRLYFALPEVILEKSIKHIPERAGILVIKKRKYYDNLWCVKMREAKNNGNYKFSDREMFELARLGAIRIWGLKKRLYAERKQLKLNL